jgi:predicted lipid-binding transport protein (Tim44 family)
MSFRPFLLALGAVLATLLLIAGDLQARPSGGVSSGSRGSRTFSAPPTTKTAPTTAAPIERSMTQPSVPSTATGLARPGTNGGFFNRPGFLGGMFAGFLGAGLLGMMFGGGLFGGLGGFASILGLLLQIGIVVVVARLLWTWWQRRQGLATANGPALRDVGADANSYGTAGASAAPSSAVPSSAAPSDVNSKIILAKSDFDDFERLLGEVSLAYGAEDVTRLGALVTPEMLSYFSEQLAQNTGRGVVNHVSGIKLLQGDLAEAWREGDQEYATLAMRYAISDTTVERASGRVVEGADTPQEVAELWTFLRLRGGNWALSAIQQT